MLAFAPLVLGAQRAAHGQHKALIMPDWSGQTVANKQIRRARRSGFIETARSIKHEQRIVCRRMQKLELFSHKQQISGLGAAREEKPNRLCEKGGLEYAIAIEVWITESTHKNGGTCTR